MGRGPFERRPRVVTPELVVGEKRGHLVAHTRLQLLRLGEEESGIGRSVHGHVVSRAYQQRFDRRRLPRGEAVALEPGFGLEPREGEQIAVHVDVERRVQTRHVVRLPELVLQESRVLARHQAYDLGERHPRVGAQEHEMSLDDPSQLNLVVAHQRVSDHRRHAAEQPLRPHGRRVPQGLRCESPIGALEGIHSLAIVVTNVGAQCEISPVGPFGLDRRALGGGRC